MRSRSRGSNALQFRGNAILRASILAGLLFLSFEMLATAMVQGANFFFLPLGMIGAIILGPAVLEWMAPLTVTALSHCW